MAQQVDKPRFENGNFIKEKLGRFWDKVRGTEEIGAVWQTYAQIVSAMTRRLYEIDSDISIQDITPNQMNLGGLKEVQGNQVQRIKLDDDVASAPEVHSRITYPKKVYFEGVDYEITQTGQDRFINFGRGPEAPGAIFTDEIGSEKNDYVFVPVKLDESNKIAQRFGSLTGLVEKDSEDYLRSVRGLWYALHFGPTPENLRIALYIFLNLPFVDQPGIIDEIDRDNNIVTMNEAKRRESLLFNPNYPNFDMTEVERDGNLWKKVDFVDKIPGNYQDPIDLRVTYENEADPEKYNYRVDDIFWFIDGRQLFIREDFFNTIIFETNSLNFIYHVPQSGAVTEYDLGRLHMRDDINEGDTIDGFSILTKNIEIKDFKSHEFEWIFNKRPPGLFHVVIDGAAFSRIEKTRRMFSFFERFKPNHSQVQFLLKRLPIHVTNLGDAKSPDFLRDLLSNNKKPLFETKKDITISRKIENSSEEFHDARLDNDLDYYIFWDHFEHDYSQEKGIPKTWGELHDDGRQWDEYYVDEHPHGKWDITNNSPVLASLNNLFHDEEIYVEIETKTVGGGPHIDLVRPVMPENRIDESGIVETIRLNNKSIVLEDGTEIFTDSQSRWSSTFSDLESVVRNGTFYTEVNTINQSSSEAEVVKEKIEGNSDFYGIVEKISLKNGKFYIQNNGLKEIKNKKHTKWGDGPHWDKTDIVWDHLIDETVPTWDNRLLSVDREWGTIGLEWDEDASWPFARYFGTVDWDDYNERWDVHNLYDTPSF